MGKFIDLTGMKFGRLTASRRDPSSFPASAGKKVKWECACDCGAQTSVIGKHLVSGNTQSCGCLSAQIVRVVSRTHGRSKDRVYNVWNHMHQRCRNPNHSVYRFYGGKGVTVCKKWSSFENFLADMGEPTPEMTLDRRDPTGNYEPDNCRWVPMEVQHNNLRKSVVWQGERLSVAEVARRAAVPRTSLNKLLLRGMDIDAAVHHAISRVKSVSAAAPQRL